VGIQHKSNLDWLQAAAGVLSTLKGTWVLAADFNCTPQQLEETGWLRLVQGKIVAPQLATCHKRVIDFFVVSCNMADMVVGAVAVGDALCKPHKPVRLYLKAGARTMMVRSLKNIGKIGAVLPHGPPLKHPMALQEVQEMDNHQKYSLFVNRMESEVSSLMALDEKAAKRFTGRADGPKYVQRNALEYEQGGARKTTSVSRAWRRTAGWLDDSLKTDRIAAKEVAMHKLLSYHHHSPAHLKATPD
jgi:hypothetical protein